MFKSHYLFILFYGASFTTYSQGGEGYREKQVPGLNQAASKIFFTEKWWSASVWGEFNGLVPVNGNRDRSSGDIELYYTSLSRVTGYLSLRPAKSIAFTFEGQIEHLTDGKGESKTEFIPEFYFDFIGNEHFNARFGIAPVHIGYINNNDEPILFYSVNRPESERLIIPTEWTEFSLQFYGSITHNLHYAIALTNGPEAKEFKAPTWIRGGKEGRLDLHGPSSVTFNPELNYSGLENWTFSLSGYFGNTGQGGKIMVNNGEKEVKAPLKILSGYARYDWKNLRLVAVGAFGKLGETEDLFQLTKETSGTGQVIGSSVYGYYIEAGWNLLKKKAGAVDSVKRKFFEKSEMALPLFFRVERFDTHAQVASAISQQPFIHNNMFIGVVGINFNPNEHLVFKADYVLRSNLSANEGTDADTDLFELGMGFSF